MAASPTTPARGPVRTPLPIMRLRHALLATAIAAGALAGAPARAAAQGTPGYLVIVNAANSASTLPRGEVAALFLKQVTTWPDGSPVVVVDLTDRSPVRAAFSRAVIGRPATAVNSYWQQQVFGGKAVPPTQRASDAEVVAYVRENPNAIGYVAPSTPLGQGIRPLTIVGK
jgi:ABC-type phosphate transport system substrate-binding protein